MHIWGLRCNRHLVMKTARVPEGIKHISDSAWRRKHTPTGEGEGGGGWMGGGAGAAPRFCDLEMLNVSAVVSLLEL